MERCRHRPGQCHLPDKEFRYLRTVRTVTPTGKLPCLWRYALRVPPACRHADRTISSLRTKGPAYSLWGFRRKPAFPADCPHPKDFHCHLRWRVPGDSTEFPAYSQVYLRNYNIWSFLKLCAIDCPFSLYSYGRRLPGLRSRASPCG